MEGSQNGSKWNNVEKIEKTTFSEEEIKESERRVEELMKKRQQNGQN